MAAPFKVKATFDYASQEADDLSFPIGQIITVTEEIDADWYEGEYTDVTGIKKSGIFPNNFVERYEPEVPSRPSRPARSAAKEAPAPVIEPRTGDEAGDEDTPVPVETPAKSITTSPALPQQELSSTQPKADISSATDSKKPPPPVAPKSNAFKDRIAAFNAPAAAPILPFVPGGRSQPSNFIRKPFVAPPPSKDAFVAQPKQETVQKPYVREEDPEIKQRQEEDLAAAQSAGLVNESNEVAEEDAPKPQSLKDRIALLQKQQLEQAQRRADTSTVKKDKKAPPPPTNEEDDDNEEADIDEEQEREVAPSRPSADFRERPRVPTLPRATEPAPSHSPAVAQHEILSGGEEADQSAAGETTEDDAGAIGLDESDERPLPPPPAHARVVKDEDDNEEEEETEVAHEDEDDDMDEETRRKLELRERMAKMSGGMGMPGMFGPPGGMSMPGMSAAKKPAREKRSTEDSVVSSSPPQSRVPMVPMPGIQRVLSPDAEDDTEPPQRQASIDGRRSFNETRGAPPPAPSERAPAPAARAVPRPPNRAPAPGTPPVPQSSADDDDDDIVAPLASSAETPRLETPLAIRGLPPRPQDHTSYFADSVATTSDRRGSRTPQVSGQPPSSARPPPPPPPALIQQDTEEDDQDRGESEYEGDYDTDIASSAKHKDALKAHNRDPSYDDTTADEVSLSSPRIPPPASRAAPPPPPPTAQTPARAPRQSSEMIRAPPPPPVAQVNKSRQSMDQPRAPPPMPSTRPDDDEEYDPYRYSQGRSAPTTVPSGAPPSIPPVPPRPTEEEEESPEDDQPIMPRQSIDRAPPPPPTHIAPQDRVPPPPPPASAQALQPPPRAPPRQSLDIQGRRSTDQYRPSSDQGQIAGDIDLAQTTPWWIESEPLPPALQGRSGVDLIFECEESQTSKRGGRTTISKDIYVLFIDYSQTIITARYDSREPSDVSLEQRHEPAPAKLRQDQLESVWERFGKHIAEAANNLGNSKKDTTVGDGSATSLVHELIKAQPQALLPVGVRAYGALVYANLANASVMQFDEIRAGDIVTLRNARFEGKHSGPMHQKYKQESGASHVAIVNEWDGTKKKIRAWEQGREKKNALKSESYRLGDLKSGEVRVWRVVGREWVGWESNA